ncbi:hypothetical protein H1P_70036 [Hyella patelloides LEGE 07179]|uniref:Uncharacterized protein n=1 Tax=Hyella patelloides LEGE 07179 TaxID=945734 RepID=A0A563W3L6_9CYAN|nr:hypothetical protein H1P_70036 [Hyella patelloides LEGE 07179]
MGKNGNPELREFYNLKAKEVAKAIAIVQENQQELINKWKTIHSG